MSAFFIVIAAVIACAFTLVYSWSRKIEQPAERSCIALLHGLVGQILVRQPPDLHAGSVPTALTFFFTTVNFFVVIYKNQLHNIKTDVYNGFQLR